MVEIFNQPTIKDTNDKVLRMNSNQFISVIIPVYNREFELKRCLNALKNQSYKYFEVVIIDDCSDVPIKSFVDAMNDERFIYIRNDKNGGPSNARIQGWKATKGTIIVNIDSDWEPYPWLLERIHHYFNEYPDVNAITGLLLRDIDSRLFIRVRDKFKKVSNFDLPNENVNLKSGDMIAGYKIEIIKNFLEKSHNYFASEYYLNIIFALNKFIVLYVDEPWCLYHLNSENRVSDTRKINLHRWVNDCRLFLDDFSADLLTNPNSDFLVNQFYSNAIFLLRNNKYKMAKEYLNTLKKIGLSPFKQMVKVASNNLLNKLIQKIKKSNNQDSSWI